MTQPTTLLLVRHAETVDNAAARLSGWTDADLSRRGEKQVELLAAHVNRAHRGAAALYASPLLRARRTAQGIGALTGHDPILDADLREMYFGALDGANYEIVQQQYSALLAADEDPSVEDFRWPFGESRREFRQRVVGAMNRIALAHPAESVTVVTHGGVVAMFLTAVQGESAALWRRWVVPNASLTEVAWDGSRESGRMLRHGEAGHLAELVEQQPEVAAPREISG